MQVAEQEDILHNMTRVHIKKSEFWLALDIIEDF